MTKIKAPQIIWFVLLAIVIVGDISLNGQPRTSHYNTLVDIPCLMLQGLLLYWGGFFTYQTK